MHFTADRGWINDPLGLSFHSGEYHLFFQHVPDQVTWGPNCHWGHATSPDLLDWTERPIVLEPGEGDDGCWSGCVVAPPGTEPALFYTSVTLPDFDVGTVRRARPLDSRWTAWSKSEIVASPPAEVDTVTFRDPFVFRDAEQWRMIVGAGLRDGTATALVYTSDDLESWRYTGLLAQRSTRDTEPVWTGSLWECPQLFHLGDRHVLVVSVWDAHQTHYTAYAVGAYADGRFVPESWQRLTFGPSPYAMSWFTDENGDPGLISWLRGVDDPAEKWAGALSLPLTPRLEAGRLVVTPHGTVARRRASPTLHSASGLSTGESASYGLDVEWTPGADDGAAGMLGLRTATEATMVELAVRDGELITTTSWGHEHRTWSMPYDGGLVRVVLDGPIVEIFTSAGVMAIPVPAESGELHPVTDGQVAWWLLD